jgi:hypothetical protein
MPGHQPSHRAAKPGRPSPAGRVRRGVVGHRISSSPIAAGDDRFRVVTDLNSLQVSLDEVATLVDTGVDRSTLNQRLRPFVQFGGGGRG